MVRRDNSRSRRQSSYRIPANRVIAVCCGETEKAYFDGLRRHVRLVTLKPVVKVGSPTQLVRYTEKLRTRDPGAFDEFWCVVDVDEFDIDEVIVAARAAGVSLAVSNPCFELWLILHFGDCIAQLGNARAAVTKLRRCLPSYEKGQFDFAVFADRVDDAIRRAKALESANPSTGVRRLVELVLSR